MTTIKSFTDISQSRKLAEILPLESADYCWGIYYESRYLDFNRLPYTRPYNTYENNDFIPCWSLAALLAVLNFPSLTQNKENEWEVCIFNHDNDDYIEKTASNPVDACYELILKLHELNLL